METGVLNMFEVIAIFDAIILWLFVNIFTAKFQTAYDLSKFY